MGSKRETSGFKRVVEVFVSFKEAIKKSAAMPFPTIRQVIPLATNSRNFSVEYTVN